MIQQLPLVIPIFKQENIVMLRVVPNQLRMKKAKKVLGKLRVHGLKENKELLVLKKKRKVINLNRHIKMIK